MHHPVKNKLWRAAGYAWFGLLAFTLLLSSLNAYRQAPRTEEYPFHCDAFGYLEMAKQIRRAASRGELPEFKVETRQTRLLIDLMQSQNVPEVMWNNIVAPHAFHYFPRSDRVGVQYPPGTGLALALFAERRAVYGLNRAVVLLLTGVGLIALLLAVIRRAWLSAGLVVLAVHVGFEILIRLGSLTYSINAILAPLLLACLLSLAALRLRASKPRLAWWAAFCVGLCLGYAVLIRLPSIFFVPGFLVLLWPAGDWRSALKGLPGALCLAVTLGGLLPLFVYQHFAAGAWYVSTYSPSVQPNLPSAEILRTNFAYYFGGGHPAEDNWSLLCLLAGFSGVVLFSRARGRVFASERLGLSWKRLAASALVLWTLPTIFFLTQRLTGLHYAMSQTFVVLSLVGFGALAIEFTSVKERERVGLSRGRLAAASLALLLVLLPAVAALGRAWSSRATTPAPAGALAHKPIILPPDLADERAWVWADFLTGTLWYYAGKPAFRLRYSDTATRAKVYRFAYERGEPQYVIDDSDFASELTREITRLGGRLVPRGEVDGYPFYLIVWPEGGPAPDAAAPPSPLAKS